MNQTNNEYTNQSFDFSPKDETSAAKLGVASNETPLTGNEILEYAAAEQALKVLAERFNSLQESIDGDCLECRARRARRWPARVTRFSRHELAANAGFDTWEDYNGTR